MPISPGATDQLQDIATGCPTFLWGSTRAVRELELVVFELPDVERGAATELSEPDTAPLKPVLEVRLPGTAPGWTPPIDQCLERASTYAWAVRALGGGPDDRRSWSSVRLFRVAGPGARELGVPRQPARGFETPAPADTPPPAEEDERFSVEREPEADRSRGASADLVAGATGIRAASGVAAPDPASAPISLRLSDSLELGPGSALFRGGEVLFWNDTGNLALGGEALSTNSTGFGNTAVGQQALRDNTEGRRNVAVGEGAMILSTVGEENVAVGNFASGALLSGDRNVAVGFQALNDSELGDDNVAIGEAALRDAIGSRNIGIGRSAGFALGAGSDNIMIGNSGLDGLEDTIRIGTPGVHQTAFIAGDLGLGTSNPSNRLHVVASDSGSTVSTHVAQIRNNSASSNADVLALLIGGLANPTASNNFVSLYNGAGLLVGQIEGNGSGGVSFASSSGDYAEWVMRLDSGETLSPGDVVGLFGDRVSRRTEGADRMLIVSGAPIVLGNDPGEERRSAYERIAFVGQVEVRVRGSVRSGDLLLASGEQDGTAVGMAAEAVPATRLREVIGRALTDADGSTDRVGSRVVALVGLPDSALLATLIEARDLRLERLERQVERLSGGRSAEALGDSGRATRKR